MIYRIKDDGTKELIVSGGESYFSTVIDYNNSTLLRIQTKPELKYFIKEVEVSEKRFYELINSIDVSSE